MPLMELCAGWAIYLTGRRRKEKYLGILAIDEIEEQETKRMRFILKFRLNCKNNTKAINIWVSVVYMVQCRDKRLDNRRSKKA